MSFSQKELHYLFEYEPLLGVFRWRIKPSRGKQVGAIAGGVQGQHGRMRRILCYAGRRIYASRAAFIYENGDIPNSALVDHINGDTQDDRIENLRLASKVQNTWNRVRSTDGQGTTKDQRGRWKARIQTTDGEKINLGTWGTQKEAEAAYLGAAAILYGDFSPINRLNPKASH